MIHRLEGESWTWIARSLNVSRSTVYRTKSRFDEEGDVGLFDHRDGNGRRKLTEEHLTQLRQAVSEDPPNYGWTRPTWTRELLIKAFQRTTGVEIGLSTMSRALQLIGKRTVNRILRWSLFWDGFGFPYPDGGQSNEASFAALE